MKVVMLQDVGGVGQKGKIVEVSDGYALNFLIPHGKAEQATPDKEAEVLKRSAAEKAHKQKEEAEITKHIQSLEGADVRVQARATEKGGLFKAITTQDVVQAIFTQKNVRIPVAVIQLEKPIKEVGEHMLTLKKDKTASKMRFVVESV